MGEDGILNAGWSRRKFITASAVLGAAAVSLGAQCDPALIRKLQQNKNPQPPHHKVWVWQFSTDSEPSRRPTTTSTPDSFRFSAWAWPCEP